jgi:hypothetical protein
VKRLQGWKYTVLLWVLSLIAADKYATTNPFFYRFRTVTLSMGFVEITIDHRMYEIKYRSKYQRMDHNHGHFATIRG